MPTTPLNVKTHSHLFDSNSLYIGRVSRYIPSEAPAPLRNALATGSGVLANEFPLPSQHSTAQRQLVIALKAQALARFMTLHPPSHPASKPLFFGTRSKLFCWCAPLACHGSLLLYLADRATQLQLSTQSPSWLQLPSDMDNLYHLLLSPPASLDPSNIPDNPYISLLCHQLDLIAPPQQTLF